jgi:amidohydrolase
MVVNFKAEATAMRDELVARRRDLHQHPEIAFEEVRTSGIVAAELNNLGFEVQTGVGKTGVVGVLEGDHDGPTVLVRADMDALPILEANETDYVSTVDGKMHACGHDGHTSILLGVAKLLNARRSEMRGRVKFVFQPAEEIGGGALAMIKDGVLAAPRPDVSLGLHLWNELPLGKVGVGSGPVMAGARIFKIELGGKGGHGAAPHQTLDPVVAAAQIVTALQTVISRELDPIQMGVLSVTQVHAGDADNVIPSSAVIRGTTRAFLPEVDSMIAERLTAISKGIAKTMHCTCEVSFRDGTIPVVNDPSVAEHVRGVFRDIVGTDAIETDVRSMLAEDMAFLMKDIPGTFFFVGSANNERGLDYGHHHPRFDFDEDVLPLGVTLMASAIASYVLPDDA